jgi:hypothetical protein
VIHRDVKPSNLILDPDGRIWLTDFGLAKRMDDVGLSMTGALLGTPRYMSPEQASATRLPVDQRTDIYSLGATLYELATGRPMFDADTPHGVITQILTTEPPPPRRVRTDLPRDLETIILKCLSKEPAKRYDTAQALADDLRAFTQGWPIKARRVSLAERTARWLRRQKRSVALTVAAVAVTLAVVLGALWGSYGYSRSKLGYLMLTTDTPPLVAEILDDQGELVAPAETLPMQKPLELPAREYQVRVMGDGQLSRTITTTMTRGNRFEYIVGLADQRLRSTVDVQRVFRLVQFDDGAGLVLMDNKGIRRVDAARDRERWALDLTDPAELPQPAAGLAWPWDKFASSYPTYGYDRFDLRPFAVSPAIDLNRDGRGDLVLAARHQAWLMAISGADGKPLWVAARAPDLRQAATDWQAQLWLSSQGVRSATLAPPEVVGDLDADGTPDLVAMFIDQRPREKPQPGQAGPQRWVEAVSGATGKTVWRFELDPRCFDLPQGIEAPYAFQWFYGSGGGSGSSGGHSRRGHRYVRSGSDVYAPDPARLVQTEHGPAIVLAAGRHLVALAPRTGKPLWPADDSGLRPGLDVIWADMDGDGWPDAVLVEEAPPVKGVQSGAPPPFPVAVFSLVKHTLLWKKEVTAFWPHQPHQTVPAPRWPVAADLDGDGACELIVPNGTSNNNMWKRAHWGDLEVLDGATGESRWKRRLMTLDEQIDHFAVGPDLDGDGVREVFAAVLWGPAPDVYVDALSGKDGHTLWHSRRPLRTQGYEPGPWMDSSHGFWMTPLSWWRSGDDGWPQLLVPVAMEGGRYGGPSGLKPVTCMFSAGTGQLTRMALDVDLSQTADANGDGVDDLFLFRADPPSALAAEVGKGKLEVLPGVRQRWHRLGPTYEPAADFDGDGVRDLLRMAGRKGIQVISGLDAKPLWELRDDRMGAHSSASPADTGTDRAAGLLPATRLGPGDLDGDGTTDLLAYANPGESDLSFRLTPLQAISGRSGHKLWSADIRCRVVAATPLVATRDLSGDGKPAVVLVCAMDREHATNRSYTSNDGQLWLVVLSGRNGEVRWKQPLTADYGGTSGRQGNIRNLTATRLEAAYGDLDGDGVEDLVLPAEASPDTKRLELRAFSGADGTVLWRHPLPAAQGDHFAALGDVPPTAIGDLRGDGRPEVVVLAFEDAPGASGGQVRTAHLWALDAKDGSARWHWSAEVPQLCGKDIQTYRPDHLKNRPRPLLLRTKAGRSEVCLNLWGEPGQVVVVDDQGKQVVQLPLSTPAPAPTSFRVWVCDIDGDGSDEVLIPQPENLLAVRPHKPDSPLWQRRTDAPSWNEVIGIVPGSQGMSPTVIVRTITVSMSPSVAAGTPVVLIREPEAGDSRVQFIQSRLDGLDAATGRVRWSCPSPPCGRSGPCTAALLSAGDDRLPPQVLFTLGSTSQVREAVLKGTNGRPETKAAATAPTWGPDSLAAAPPDAMGDAVDATLRPRSKDPRLLRKLPWARENRASEMAYAIGLAAFYSVTLVILPVGYVGWLVWRRQWGLRTMLLAPVVLAVMMMGAMIGPYRGDFSVVLLEKWTQGFAALPAFVFLALTIRWYVKHRWRRLAVWHGIAVLLAVVATAVALLIIVPLEGGSLQPGERWDLEGWYCAWFAGAYLTAWAMSTLLPAYYGIRAARRWFRSRSAAVPGADRL